MNGNYIYSTENIPSKYKNKVVLEKIEYYVKRSKNKYEMFLDNKDNLIIRYEYLNRSKDNLKEPISIGGGICSFEINDDNIIIMEKNKECLLKDSDGNLLTDYDDKYVASFEGKKYIYNQDGLVLEKTLVNSQTKPLVKREILLNDIHSGLTWKRIENNWFWGDEVRLVKSDTKKEHNDYIFLKYKRDIENKNAIRTLKVYNNKDNNPIYSDIKRVEIELEDNDINIINKDLEYDKGESLYKQLIKFKTEDELSNGRSRGSVGITAIVLSMLGFIAITSWLLILFK